MTANDQGHNELLISWLNDAYAMEKGVLPALENSVKNAKEFPELSEKIQQQVDATNRHVELVRKCVEHLGGKVSALKGGIGSFLSKIKNIAAPAGSQDELLKDALAGIGAAHFAIACYQAILAAAEHNGDEEIAETCRVILHDEEEMAQWLSGSLPLLTHQALHHRVHHGQK